MKGNTDKALRCIARAVMLVAIIAAILPVNRLSAQAKFYASAPKSVPVNQGFQVTFTLENASGNNLKLPASDDFQVIGGPSTSQNMQFIGNGFSQSISWTYVYKPKKEGTFKLGKASVSVAGVTMQSNELTIEITKAAAAQPQAKQRYSDPFGDDGQEDVPQGNPAEMAKQLREDIFLKLAVNKSSVFKGEVLTATYKLYFRQNLSSPNITKAPAFDGFWSQEVELSPARRPSIEVINGRQYYVLEILKYNLYPQRAGSLNIPLLEINTSAQVMVPGRPSFFDPFGMGRAQQVPLTVKSASANVTVKELPASQPAGFSGAVGKYTYEVKLSSTNAKTDEPITYSVKIGGTGNLKLVEQPEITFPQSFEVYDPKIKEALGNGAEGLTGSRQYDYLLIPRQPGDYKIDAQTFSYFDPAAARYYTINSPEFTVKVTGEPSKNVNANTTAGVNQTDVSLLGQDIRYIKTGKTELKEPESFFGSAGFVALYASPFLMFIGLVFLKRRNEELAADVIGAKRRKALRQAKKRLANAEKFLAQHNKKGFYDETSRAMWGYLGDKLNIDMAELSKDNVEEKLIARQVKAESVVRLRNLINTCELALYAPVGGDDEMRQNYQAALNLIADLEDEIKQWTH